LQFPEFGMEMLIQMPHLFVEASDPLAFAEMSNRSCPIAASAIASGAAG
jgi:hypothetical protein